MVHLRGALAIVVRLCCWCDVAVPWGRLGLCLALLRMGRALTFMGEHECVTVSALYVVEDKVV